MQIRQTWLTSAAFGLLVSTQACDGKETTETYKGKDAGAGGENTGGKGGNMAPPDLNYIPANEGKCDLGAKPELKTAARDALGLLTDLQTTVATEFQICPKEQAGRVCAPCNENPFLDWLNAVDAADDGGSDGKDGRMPLVEYFRRALQYPLRDLLVIDTGDVEEPHLMLAQAKAASSCTEHTSCRDFLLQHESTEKDCMTLTQLLPIASATSQDDGSEVIKSKASKNPFAFYVPLVTELPTYPLANPPEIPDTNPQACPSAAEVGSEADFKAFLLCHPNLRMSINSPELTKLRTQEGAQCMQLSGLVAVTDLPDAAQALVDTADYEDLDAPGYIRVSLSARLFESTVKVDPSLTGEEAL
jgi:hypothetical protein